MKEQAVIDSEISAFLDYIKHEKRYSVHTLSAYENDLLQFRAWIKTNAPHHAQLYTATHFEVRSWMAALMNEEYTSRSVNRKVSSLRAFFRYHQRKGTIQHNPMKKIQSLRSKSSLPVFVDKNGMKKLTDHVQFPEGYEGLLHRSVLETLYGTGMRRSELAGMRRANVDVYNSQLKVMGKGGKERIIPVHGTLLDLLRQLMAASPESEYLFVTARGAQLSVASIYSIVKRYLRLVTTLSKQSPHVLRHTFATHLLNNGADINAVKELLGHSSLAATQVYTHNTIDKLRSIHKQAHPKG